MLSVEVDKLGDSDVGLYTIVQDLAFLIIIMTLTDSYTMLCRRRPCLHTLLSLLHCLQPYQPRRQWKQKSMESTYDFTSPVLNTPEAPQFSPVTPSASTPEQVSTTDSPPTSNQHIPPHASTPAAAPVTPCTTQVEPTEQRPGGKKTSSKHGVKVVGDNVDKNLRPRLQTIEKQTTI